MPRVILTVNRKIGTPGSFKGPILIQYVKEGKKITRSQEFGSTFEEDAQIAYEIAAAYPGTITIEPVTAAKLEPEEKAMEKAPVNKMLKPEATK